MTDKEAKRRSLQWERGLKCGNRKDNRGNMNSKIYFLSTDLIYK